jgi:hypothetical protein
MSEPRPETQLDTGAGTPFTADDLRTLVLAAQYRFGRMAKIPDAAWVLILEAARSRPATDPDFSLLEDEDGAPFPDAVQEVVRERERDAYRAGYQTALAARSRPATDPAGLDEPTFDAAFDAIEAACPVCGGDRWTVEADPSDESGQTPMQVQCWDAEHVVVADQRAILRARLSVADGAGPEERLRAALDAIVSRAEHSEECPLNEAQGWSGDPANCSCGLSTDVETLRAALPVHREEPTDD